MRKNRLQSIVSLVLHYVSQGSVAMQLKYDGISNNLFVANCHTLCASERIFKSGQYLLKIQTKVRWHVFFLLTVSKPGVHGLHAGLH